MSALRRAVLAGGAMLVAACGPVAAQDRPAVVVSPSAESRAELERVLSAASDGQPVALAPDALTRASTVAIERRTPPGAQGRAATGRTLDAPARFDLVLRGERCLLVRASDAREWPLEQTRCAPAEPPAR